MEASLAPARGVKWIVIIINKELALIEDALNEYRISFLPTR